ncbi:MAG: TIGR03617 family F420-dependent LLM class oxidoreductase [Halieaceae bacterium]|nr:TIGR03617 family F420-dependent LLM class oxidoreductase [Halieaceae bacterium]
MKIDGTLMASPTEVGTMAADLEKAGFDGGYIFEGPGDPFISTSVAALGTTKIELMTAVAIAFARNPMNLAYLGNDLQNLSRGRFTLGLGTQIKAHIERRFNMPWSKPAARMRELVLATRAIWECWQTGGKLDFKGEFYSHTLMPPLFMPPANEYGPPKIFLAAVGPLMTEVAAEVGDGYFVHPFCTDKSLNELSLAAIDRGLEKAGKRRSDFSISAQVITATGLTEENLDKAKFMAKSQIAFYASTPAYRPVLECHGWGELQVEANRLTREGKWAQMAELIDDQILETIAVVGSPEEVATKIAGRYRGKVERICPMVYEHDMTLLEELQRQIRSALDTA